MAEPACGRNLLEANPDRKPLLAEQHCEAADLTGLSAMAHGNRCDTSYFVQVARSQCVLVHSYLGQAWRAVGALVPVTESHVSRMSGVQLDAAKDPRHGCRFCAFQKRCQHKRSLIGCPPCA